MKRRICITLALVLIVSLFSGCGVSTSGSSAPPSSPGSSGSTETQSTASTPAKGAVVIKLAGIYGEFMTESQSMHMFEELLEERSNGYFDVQVYTASQLGSEDALIEGIGAGAIEMACVGHVLANYLPYAGLTDHSFVFDNLDHARACLSDPETIKKTMAGDEEFGMITLGFAPSMFRCFFSKTPINGLADLKGLRTRVTSAYCCYRSAECLGCNTVVLPMTEIFTSLEQGVIDAVETPPIITHANKYDEVLKYVYPSYHMFTAHHWHVNKAFFESLPAEYQDMIVEVANECMEWDWDAAEAAEAETYQAFQDAGMTIVYPTEEEIAEMREMCSVMDDEVEAQNAGSKEILEYMRSYSY